MTSAGLASPQAQRDSQHDSGGQAVRQSTTAQLIEHAAHYLPSQGPITVFIHHNTLHAFEHLKFDQGVQQGGKLFGCQPYLSEDRYRQHLQDGRIRVDDLAAVLLDDLGDRADQLLGFMGTRFHFRLAMLRYPPRTAHSAELRWFVAETDALTRVRSRAPAETRRRLIDETRHWILRDIIRPANGDASPKLSQARGHELLEGLLDRFGRSSVERWSERNWEAFTLQALWRICRSGVHGVKSASTFAPRPLRHRDLLLQATGGDSDILVHDVLIRVCSAFLDQGFSHWPMPERERGLFAAFAAVYGQQGGPPDVWLAPLAGELARVQAAGLSPLASIDESLRLLGVAEAERADFVTSSLLALPGWAGMIHQVELRSDSVARPIPPGSLTEFLAVRLILERLALAHVARETLAFAGPLSELRGVCRRHIKGDEPPSVEQRAFLVFQLAQALGWLPSELIQLSQREWTTLIHEIESFPDLERRRVYHAAFERRYRVQTLDAISIHARRGDRPAERPRFQLSCCLDDREESFRRHLEEVCPEMETFGVAAFYAVAMYYRGVADAHYTPLCPIVIRPQHWVQEKRPTYGNGQHPRALTRKALGVAWHQAHVASRGFAAGALLAAGLGSLASVPLVARVLFPRLTARLRRLMGRLVHPPQSCDLELERVLGDVGAHPDGGHLGYTIDEMTDIADRLLRELGLTRNFARLVVFLGHGSNSLNNPHNSAYNCGACGGNAGGPNARAAARMLNDSRVRDTLRQRGLEIPGDTVFVGGWHNTCNDVVTLFDLERLPESHRGEFEELHGIIEEACDRNAHERCRRFQSAPLNMSFAAARKHVEARSEDLSQTRPECGHASNAVCFVGRRGRTKGLFLDRRTFLTSYDPTEDDAEQSIFARTMAAAVPVCAGINLEYYFSYVDPVGYGCGTKLPHNVASLLGVMNGAASDLRTGLPWQMVEIHEPVRLLFIVETTPEVMLRLMDKNEGIGRVCRNDWMQLATLDPDSPQIHFFRDGRFEAYHPESSQLPVVASSVDWYRGWRENLGYAQIDPTRGGTS